MNHDATDTTLSLAGLRRRDAMRGELLDAFAAMTRTRTVQRRAFVGAGVALVAVAAVWVGGRMINPAATPEIHETHAVAVQLVEMITTPANTSAIDFAYVGAANIGIVQYVPPDRNIVEIIDDETLIRTLAQMHRPAGLIEMGNTVRLTRDVVDDAGGDSTPSRGSNLGQPLLPGNTPPATGV